MRFDLLLQRLADKASRWEGWETGARHRKRVQVKTLADLKAIGEELGGHTGEVRYQVGGGWKSSGEIAEMTDTQLNQLTIFTYPPDEEPNGSTNYFMCVTITNSGQIGTWKEPAYAEIQYSLTAPGHMAQTMVRRGMEVVEACTRPIRWWQALRPYPVVRTITKATAEQRAHDRKIRWQSAILSFLVSAPVAIISAVATVILGPSPSP